MLCPWALLLQITYELHERVMTISCITLCLAVPYVCIHKGMWLVFMYL